MTDVLTGSRGEWAETLHETSEQTRIVYRRSVDQFLAWLADTHPDVTAPAHITKQHVHGWLGSLLAAGRSDRLIAVRLWLGYITEEEDSGLTVNPARDGCRRAGTPVSVIAAHGRWSPGSPVVLSYVRAVDRWRDNALTGVGL